jgi:1-aminocyclopropane-1-carboxylate deaminase
MTSLEAFARYPLLFGPSPIQWLDRLTKRLGGTTLWAKREDCNSGYGRG